MSLFDEGKNTTRLDIDSIDDIYKQEKQILDTVKKVCGRLAIFENMYGI